MANFLFKLILLGGIGWVIYMVATGNMGGAKEATGNYQKQLLGDRYQDK